MNPEKTFTQGRNAAVAVAAMALGLPGLICAALPPITQKAPTIVHTQPGALAALHTLGLSLENADFVRAVATQNRALIDLFLAADIDVNQTDPKGRSALFAATASQQWDLAQKLIEKGADCRQADDAGRTALMAAVIHGQSSMADTLLARGADPSALDENEHSALHFAVTLKNRELVARLSKLCPPSNKPCCDGHDLMSHAFKSRDWGVIEPILSQIAPMPAWGSEARGLLQNALQSRDIPRIRLLLSKHLTPPVPDGRKQPLIAYALVTGQRGLFQLLLDAGADPNSMLQTPAEDLFTAMIPSRIVRQYVEGEPGMNLLMLAAGLGRPADVKLLLDKGARRGQVTKSKYKLAALNFAAWAQCPESQQLLLGKCPSPDELRIEISIGGQSASLYKKGVPVLTTHISTGRPGFPTPEGRFVITDKHSHHISTIYKVKMPFFMRLSCREFGMHEGYAEDPFASHGCIRVPEENARRLFQQAPVGTLVCISR